ncbi:MAG: hypothetical protein MJ068_04445 [Clostridia bacterium]|nr:hypothetical protein [Clostridia bacterium]
MKANEKDILATKIYFQAAFPALSVPFEEAEIGKQPFAKKFEKINAVVEFRAPIDDEKPCEGENALACYVVFLTEEQAAKTEAGKRFKVYQGVYEEGAIKDLDGKALKLKVTKFYFKSIKSLLGVFKGDTPLDMLGIVGPLLKNIAKPATLKFLFLMLTLMKTMPNVQPTTEQPFEQYLKVKLSLYLITRALSVANKENWDVFKKWGQGQPDRTYQFRVGATKDANGKVLYPEILANLRVKTITKTGELKTKSSHGDCKYPFVSFSFPTPDDCIAVLTNRYDFVDCVAKGCVTIVGAGDSYAITFNGLMTECQNMLVPSKLVQE